MFNATIAKTQLIDALNKVEFGNLGIVAGSSSLQLRASGIRLACELFANFIEEMAADADASITAGGVDERDARGIADVGADLAGQIVQASELQRETA